MTITIIIVGKMDIGGGKIARRNIGTRISVIGFNLITFEEGILIKID